MVLDEIYELNLDDLKKEFIGKEVVLSENIIYGEHNNGMYIPGSFEKYKNQIFKIKTIDYGSSHKYIFKIFYPNGNELWLGFEMIGKIVIKSNKKNIEVKKGDLVKLLPKSEKQVGEFYGIPIVEMCGSDNEEYEELSKHGFIVQDVVNDKILPYYLDNKWRDIIIDTNMVEVAKEDYIGHIKEKTRKLKSEKKILEDFEIMEEMKTKVNIKDFKKIYAGALKLIPNNLKGIDLLLQQWAFNKKEIYKVLGKELAIRKEIECSKDENMVKDEVTKMCNVIPAFSLMLPYVSYREILSNKLEHEISLFSNTKVYTAGDKVSKMIAEIYQSEKLNMLLSDIIAQTKVKGIVEVSIDPIEYLLMSCNISGWTSCHTIYKIGHNAKSYGCYSAGIFSYMCDNVSLIAFKHDGKEYDFKIANQTIKAKSKNWRQMVWLDKKYDFFVTSRQYPVDIKEANEAVRELIEGSINSNNEEKKWIHSHDQRKVKARISNYKPEKRALHYNDILNGYNGDLCYKKGIDLKNKKTKVGSFPICPSCGERLLESPGIPFCDECYKII